jgi:hypothetical protein
MKTSIKLLGELQSQYKGLDIYVAGSGPSLGYIGDSFMKDKTVICVNHAIDHVVGANRYVVSKEPDERLQRKAKERRATLVTCDFHSALGVRKNKVFFPENTVLFKPERESEKHPFKQPHSLTVSASTITTAMHLAAYMGAKTIVLIGHDCGTLDDEVHVTNYDKSMAVTPVEHYAEWMRLNSVEQQTLKMKKVLERRWGIEVYSINPFINFRLEGHRYKSFSFPS